MKFLTCPCCKKDNISENAMNCPNCGYPIKQYYEVQKFKKQTCREKQKVDTNDVEAYTKYATQSSVKGMGILAIFGLVVSVINILLFCFSCKTNSKFFATIFLLGSIISVFLFFVGIIGFFKDSNDLNLIETDFNAYQSKIKEKQEEHKQKQTLNAECPYCHSKNTKKITTTSKVTKLALFGVFTLPKANKEWHCNNCNSDF